MENRLTNTDVIEFLGGFEKESQTLILEEGKEKAELEKIAEARGMKIKGSRDLAIFKTIFLFTDRPNSNGAILPKKELLRILPQLIGKPINKNHNRRYILGHFIDYKFKQKENKVIAYGVFYKSAFADEWTHAKELFRKRKLASSFEIWSPDEAREDMGGGKYRLHKMEIAGGALIFIDKNNIPAFKDAKVLEMARKDVPELVYASKYNESEIITSKGDYFKESVKENLKKIQEEKKQTKKEKEANDIDLVKVKKEIPTPIPEIEVKKEEKPKEEVKVEKKAEEKKIEPKIEEKKVEPTTSKIKCGNCEHEWEIGSQIEHTMGSEKCPKCFAIIDQTGKMIYPPQIIDFTVSCPSCRVGNWLVMEKGEHALKIKCLSCAHEYQISFETEIVKTSDTMKELKFMYSGNVACYQCGTRIHFTNPSNIKTKTLKCKKCGLDFTSNIEENRRYKNISKIEEIKAMDKLEKSSEKGGNKTMELKPNVEKEKVIIPKDSEESKEVAKEVKVENVVVDDTTKLNDSIATSKVDVEKAKVEEQPKAKETPEAKVEEPKAEETPKAKEAPKTEEKQGNELVESMRDKVEKDADKYSKSKVLRKAIVKIKDSKKALETANKESELRKTAIKKLANKIIGLRKEVELYKVNAKKIIERREELGEEYAKDLTDNDIVNDDKFSKVKAEKENILLKAKLESSSEEDIVVGIKPKGKDDNYYNENRKKIDSKAFPKK